MLDNYKLLHEKNLGIMLLTIPVVFLSLFLFGEVLSGEIGGFVHLVQIVPIILLLFAAFKFPKISGFFLAFSGIILGITYALTATQFPFATIILIETLLFAPLFLSGMLLFNSEVRLHGKD